MKLWMRSLVGLSLMVLLVVSLPAAASSAPAPAKPIVSATLQVNEVGMHQAVPRAYEFSRAPRYVLQVVGTNFVPGAAVKLALIDTSNLRTMNRGSTSVSLAGTFHYQAIIGWVPPSLTVHLWCRSLSHMDFHEVMRI